MSGAVLSPDWFWDRVRSRRTIISDGAVGSELIGEGTGTAEIIALNLRGPDRVRAIHAAYLQAGADFITSNTFGTFDGGAAIEAMRAGRRVACEAVGAGTRDAGVWCSIAGSMAADRPGELSSFAAEVAGSRAALLVETCTTLEEAQKCVSLAATAGLGLLAVTAHFRSDGRMVDGTTPEAFASIMVRSGADVVGANCGELPELFVELTARMRSATGAPLLIQPSAGLPKQDGAGAWLYPVGPDRFAGCASEIVAAGADIIGGCCGTTPAHVAAVRARLRHEV
jgi:5-methyltetrahydrofolate--homocysteine methyltransferase